VEHVYPLERFKEEFEFEIEPRWKDPVQCLARLVDGRVSRHRGRHCHETTRTRDNRREKDERYDRAASRFSTESSSWNSVAGSLVYSRASVFGADYAKVEAALHSWLARAIEPNPIGDVELSG
jgi:hypothetical protein